MIGYFKKRKFKREVEKLETNLLSTLKEHFPDLAENHDHWILSTVMMLAGNEKTIQLMHMTTDLDYEAKNKAKHRKNFKIEGIEIMNKQSGQYIPIKIHVYGNLMQHIFLQNNIGISKEYDLESIRVNKLTTETLKTENPDEEILRKILKNLSKDKLEQIEIADTFEIELDNKFYYTVFDMEDGNYIAVNKHGKVFRLIHDHEIPARKIFDSLDLLLDSSSVDKKDLEKYFID